MPLFLFKKLQAIQKKIEEKERLAEIERKSRPITHREVREKLSKQPAWRQVAARKRSSEEKPDFQPIPAASEPDGLGQEPLATYPPPGESISQYPPQTGEPISQYPPPGEEKEKSEPLSQYPPPSEERPALVQYPPPRSQLADQRKGKMSPGAVTSQPVDPRKAKTPLGGVPSQPLDPRKAGKTLSPSPSSSAPVPPSHHMQTGELVYSCDPVVAKRQKELYAPSQSVQADSAPPTQESLPPVREVLQQEATEISFKIREKVLRERLVHRVPGFKTGRSQSGGGSTRDEEPPEAPASTSTAEQVEEAPHDSSKVGEAPPPTTASADELVVESTGELSQAPPMDVAPLNEPTASDNTGSQASNNTSFQEPSRIAPETGIMEGEPGEIMEDSNAETEEMSGAGAEVGSVKSQEEEGRVPGEEEGESKNVLVRGKCYMDMERGEERHDVADKAR